MSLLKLEFGAVLSKRLKIVIIAECGVKPILIKVKCHKDFLIGSEACDWLSMHWSSMLGMVLLWIS
jgi:hypothetical protein